MKKANVSKKTKAIGDKVAKEITDNIKSGESGKTGQGLRVPVLNMRGKPLMPTSPAKARHLLEQGKATVVTRKPFTIQLTIATGESKQPITVRYSV